MDALPQPGVQRPGDVLLGLSSLFPGFRAPSPSLPLGIPKDLICTILVKVMQIKFLTKTNKLLSRPPGWGSAARGCAARTEVQNLKPQPGVQRPGDKLLGLSSLSPGFGNPPAWGSAAWG